MKLKLIPIIILLLHCYNSLGQQLPQFSHFSELSQYFNPAFTETKYDISAAIAHKRQWAGIEGAPTTQILQFSSSLNRNLSIGLSAYNDVIGAQKNVGITPSFSYKAMFDKKHNIVFGLNGNLTNYSLNFSDLKVVNPNDRIYVSNSQSKVFNFGFGFKLNLDKAYFAASVPLILERKISPTNFNSTQSKHYYFSFGTMFFSKNSLQIIPEVLVKTTISSPVSVDNKLNFLYKETVNIGVLYRYNNSLGLNAGITFASHLTIGYAYEIAISEINSYTADSHEIFLRFSSNQKSKEKSQPKFY